MPRQRSPKRDSAYQLWIDSGKKKKLKDIAAELEVSESQIRKWKNQDNWNGNITNKTKGNVTKRKKGGQPGNKNAVGGNQSAPLGNNNAEKHGFFRKHLPEETMEIIEEMPTDNLDILHDQIQIAYAAIIRAQSIMYVKDKDDKTVEKMDMQTSQNSKKLAYDIQYAWDKQGNFLQAQARAQKTLESMINRYEELLHKDWRLTAEEQQARVDKIKAETAKTRGEDLDSQVSDDGFIEALSSETAKIWEE